ncbi:hypothetical protein [Rhizobacter sp. OV335]|uniref:hypothetical protein n=1 Tax=Rhizobacter sp. OV335 TaxID=1500264 RepID=UPI0009376DCB|nr:hypothetical protein [Rhizobacter sp. OV335]
MTADERHHLLADQQFLRDQLAQLPASALLTRSSTEARLRAVETRLQETPEALEPEPARARLTFSGAPVVASRGVSADFGMRAVNSFSEAIAAMAASLSAPLAASGPIPNRGQNPLLITSTALGSFGFELEEHSPDPTPSLERSAMATALERMHALLASTFGTDEELADVASETDRRAVEKVRAFLKVLADHDAVCTLQVADRTVRYVDVGQVKQSLQRLAEDNLHEDHVTLTGHFTGLLPQARTFEFKTDAGGQLLRGKIAPTVEDIAEINRHLGDTVPIDVLTTQVGNGRPRYLLVRSPRWT